MKGEIHSAVEVEHRRASGIGQGVQQSCVEGNLLQVTAAAFRLGPSHQVDDDVPHGARHAGVEVFAALSLYRPTAHETQKALVYERTGVQKRKRVVAAQARASDLQQDVSVILGVTGWRGVWSMRRRCGTGPAACMRCVRGAHSCAGSVRVNHDGTPSAEAGADLPRLEQRH